jgi:hypothetical protein
MNLGTNKNETVTSSSKIEEAVFHFLLSTNIEILPWLVSDHSKNTKVLGVPF